ncbi:hypothetical protein V1283_007063 [Bradyrhizobium sp. AZCC 2262]|uniref:hypothetical protein n=1 Tax=Bradyrhizobium sp. AZCC 2262 TaxID=3117022 RepID=UPI002FF2C1BB
MHAKSMKRLHTALLLAASVLPLLVLFRLAVTALYASPETDDFCFSYHYAVDGLFGTVALFYKTAIGRILPMVIMTLPAMLSRAIPLDMFIVYPLMMFWSLLAFIAVSACVCNRLWPAIPGSLLLFLSATFAATIGVNAVSFREMFLWLPGIACYLVPAAMVLVVLTELTVNAMAGAQLSTRQIAVLGALCFLAATCNEFTPVWIMAVIGISFAARGFTEFRRHAILGACTLAGFLVLLAAPGNLVRISLYPAGGRIWPSIDGAINYFAFDLMILIGQPTIIAWLGIVATVSIFVMSPKPVRLLPAAVVVIGIPALFLLCSFITFFIAYYATGELLALRARNEIEVFIIASLTISVAGIARFAGQFLPSRPLQMQTAGIILSALLCVHLLGSPTMAILKTERPTFNTFWLESVHRHASIALSGENDIVVPNRTVRPSLLMQEDLTDNPGRLPNDCVAAFYGRKSVIMQPAP